MTYLDKEKRMLLTVQIYSSLNAIGSSSPYLEVVWLAL